MDVIYSIIYGNVLALFKAGMEQLTMGIVATPARATNATFGVVAISLAFESRALQKVAFRCEIETTDQSQCSCQQ